MHVFLGNVSSVFNMVSETKKNLNLPLFTYNVYLFIHILLNNSYLNMSLIYFPIHLPVPINVSIV